MAWRLGGPAALVLAFLAPQAAGAATYDLEGPTARGAFLSGGVSLVLPGSGQFLNQEPTKGWLHLATGVALVGVPWWLASHPPSDPGLSGELDGPSLALPAIVTVVVVNAGFHLYSALDAYQVKMRVRRSGAPF